MIPSPIHRLNPPTFVFFSLAPASISARLFCTAVKPDSRSQTRRSSSSSLNFLFFGSILPCALENSVFSTNLLALTLLTRVFLLLNFVFHRVFVYMYREKRKECLIIALQSPKKLFSNHIHQIISQVPSNTHLFCEILPFFMTIYTLVMYG